MKKVFLSVLLFVLTSLCAMGQVQIKGVFGLNISKLTDFDSKPGFHAGVSIEKTLPKLSDHVYFNAGALLSLKGCKQEFLGESSEMKMQALYLELPIHMGYRYDFNSDFSLWGEAGPYIAVGLCGKTKGTTLVIDTTPNFDPDYGYGYDDPIYGTEKSSFDTFSDGGLKRFDIGAGLKLGATFKQKYSLSLGYDWGFLDLYDALPAEENEIDATPTVKNRNFTLTFAYTF